MKMIALAPAVIVLSLPGVQDTVRLQEKALRGAATVSPKPTYPQASLDGKVSGVIVAALSIAADGRVAAVEILEAPDDAMRAAVVDACKQWVVPWKVGPRGEAARPRTGKLTFYFRVVNGAGRVFNPAELTTLAATGARANPSGASASAPATAPPAATAPTLETLTLAAFRNLPVDKRPIVLDTGTRESFARGHTDGATNIPTDELSVRASIELNRSRPTAIDCTREAMWKCQAAGSILRQQGFSTVLILVG